MDFPLEFSSFLLRRPCRIDPRMAFEYAFEQIKPADVVNVGMYRGDNDNMAEENAAIAREILCRQASPKV